MNNIITGHEPAFMGIKDNGEMYSQGLTIRQHFAAMFLQGQLSNSNCDISDMISDSSIHNFAVDACRLADALIAELNR